MKGAPLEIALEHAGPAHARGQAKRGNALLQRRAQRGVVRSRQHQMQCGMLGGHAGEGFDQQVAALLLVDPAEEQHAALVAHLRESAEEGLTQGHAVLRRLRRAVACHHLPAPIRPERATGAQLLLAAREQHAARVTQDPIVPNQPVEALLQMLERIVVAKPGVQHAVRKHKIRYPPATQRQPHGQGVELPQPFDNDRVVLFAMRAQPGHHVPVESVLER